MRRRIAFVAAALLSGFLGVLVACGSFDEGEGAPPPPPAGDGGPLPPVVGSIGDADGTDTLDAFTPPVTPDGGFVPLPNGGPEYCVDGGPQVFCLDFDHSKPVSDPDAGLTQSVFGGGTLTVGLLGRSAPNALIATLPLVDSFALESLAFKNVDQTVTVCGGDVKIVVAGAAPSTVTSFAASDQIVNLEAARSATPGFVDVSVRGVLPSPGGPARGFGKVPIGEWWRVTMTFDGAAIGANAGGLVATPSPAGGTAAVMVWGPNSTQGGWEIHYDNLSCNVR